MFETILVPLDGSELAEAARATGVERQAKFGSRLLLLRAVEPLSRRLAQPPAIFESPAAAAANVELLEKMTAAEREEAQTYLEALRPRLERGGRVEALVMEGEAAEAVVSAAAARGADLVVMSSHGRGGLGRLVFGSVADAVLRQSGVPVLLIRRQEREG